MNYQIRRSRIRREGSVGGVVGWVFALLAMPGILSGTNLIAQTNVMQSKTTQQRESASGIGGRSKAEINADVAKASQKASEEMPERPLVSSDPRWPANQSPNPAIVRWDSRGLEIEASNSSLDQILHQVAAQTGARLEGRFTPDQRVFGRYGPGPGYEVLSKLLEGAGYNVLISGSRDADVLREIILSSRLPTAPQMATNIRNRDYSRASSQVEPERREEDSTKQVSSQPNQDPFNIGGPQRDRVEFMQEILQRQSVIDQQQQSHEQRSNP